MSGGVAKVVAADLIAGLLAGLLAFQGGSTWQNAAIVGSVVALRGLQSYLAPSPPQEPPK
jgi:hypothetical protein